jgi:phosphatidate phosphatase APP1
MARNTLFGNARTRLPIPGMPALFAALARGSQGTKLRNPIFYISSSPWNLYELIVEFFKLQEIPAGPLLLRDWGLTSDTRIAGRHHEHKLGAIERVLAESPGLPFLLIGDSGQADPEIYREAVHRYPGRIRAVYIRRVRRDADRDRAIALLADEIHAAGSELLVTDDARAAARHAAERQWIAAEAVAEVDRAAIEGAARPRA